MTSNVFDNVPRRSDVLQKHILQQTTEVLCKVMGYPASGVVEQPDNHLLDMAEYDKQVAKSLNECQAKADQGTITPVTLPGVLVAVTQQMRTLRDYNLTKVSPRNRLLSGYRGMLLHVAQLSIYTQQTSQDRG